MFRPDSVQPGHEPFALAAVVQAIGSAVSELHVVAVWAEDVEAAEDVGLMLFATAGEVHAVRAIPVGDVPARPWSPNEDGPPR